MNKTDNNNYGKYHDEYTTSYDNLMKVLDKNFKESPTSKTDYESTLKSYKIKAIFTLATLVVGVITILAAAILQSIPLIILGSVITFTGFVIMAHSISYLDANQFSSLNSFIDNIKTAETMIKNLKQVKFGDTEYLNRLKTDLKTLLNMTPENEIQDDHIDYIKKIINLLKDNLKIAEKKLELTEESLEFEKNTSVIKSENENENKKNDSNTTINTTNQSSVLPDGVTNDADIERAKKLLEE